MAQDTGNDFPWLAFGLTALNMFRPQPAVGALDPSKYKELLMYSPKELAAIRRSTIGDLRSNINMMNMQNIAAIKQAGAAKRLPAGAVLSGIGGASYQGGRAFAEALPRIEANIAKLKKSGQQNYFNALNQYNMALAMAQNMQQANQQETLGGLGKIALMWQAGLI